MPPRWILRYNIKFFQVYHLLGLIPFRVDQNGQSALDKTGISWKARQWINISLGIFSALFVALRFFQDTALKKSSGDIWMVLIHAIFLAGSSSMTIWNVHLFWRRPELANKVYNELIQSVRNEKIEKMGTQEWVIALLPLAFMVIQVEMVTMYLLIPRHPQYLLSLLPPDSNMAAVLICIVYDLYVLTTAMTTGHYGVIVQLLYMQTRKTELQAKLCKLREPGAPTGVQ